MTYTNTQLQVYGIISDIAYDDRPFDDASLSELALLGGLTPLQGFEIEGSAATLISRP